MEMMDFYKKLSDRHLVVLMRENDRRAFTEIYQRYHSLLFIYVHKKLKDTAEAQDIVQDVLLALWDRRQEFTPQISLSPYLYAMARNKAFDRFSRKKVEDRYLASLQGFIDSPEPTDFLIRERDIQAIIDRELEALPPRMREIFSLSRKERMTNKEIAELLDLSPHTVDTQIKRALKVLRLRLDFSLWLLVAFLF